MCCECLLTSAGRCPPVVSLPVNITTTAYVICSEETGANLNMQNNVGWYFLRLTWFYSQSLIILNLVTNFRELQWCLVTGLARAGLDPVPLCCDLADG